MAEVTKRKIASIYSLIAGFFLSLFSGHAHAGQFMTRKPVVVEAGKTQVQADTSSSLKAGSLMAPAPTQAGSLMAPAPAGSLMSPAPAGSLMSPAPEGAVTVEVQNATTIGDEGMKGFVVEEATKRGWQPDQLSTSDMNNLRTEYLLQQIRLLQDKVDQLQ